MDAQFYIPRKLNGLANVIWEQKNDTPSGWQILPSGFVELIFNLGPPMDNLQGKRVGKSFNPTENFCFLSGLHTKPLHMSYRRFHTFGVQLHPLAVKTLFGLPCNEVRDWAIPGDQLLKELNQIEDRLCGNAGFDTKARWLENYLSARISESSELFTGFKIKDVIRQVKKQGYEGKKVKIEDLTGYSRMHTHKLFNDWFGLAPSNSVRLSKFTDALKLFHTSSGTLTNIGLESGFYDQAHFIHVFKEFAGMLPGAYRKKMSSLVGQFPY